MREPAAHHHTFSLTLSSYKQRLRECGWLVKNDFFATKAIAGREVVMLIDPALYVERSDGPVTCKVMWASTAKVLAAASASAPENLEWNWLPE